jgi:hypothetical protein
VAEAEADPSPAVEARDVPFPAAAAIRVGDPFRAAADILEADIRAAEIATPVHPRDAIMAADRATMAAIAGPTADRVITAVRVTTVIAAITAAPALEATATQQADSTPDEAITMEGVFGLVRILASASEYLSGGATIHRSDAVTMTAGVIGSRRRVMTVIGKHASTQAGLSPRMVLFSIGGHR